MSKSDGKDPPKDGRFRKGQSGNPNGRPKKPRSPIADALTLKMAEQKVTVRDTDGSHELTGIEVAYKARFKSVVGGSAMAQRDYIRAFEEADAARRAKIDEEIEWAHNYIRDARPIFERAAQRGEPEPPELVHPDDVIIDPKLGVRFRGPFVGDLRAALDKVIAFRDALLLQSILDDRCALKADRADPERWPGTARLMMNIVEMLLPVRFRKTEKQIFQKAFEYRRTPKRQLVKDVHAAWKAAGLPVPRGATFPPFRQGVRMTEQILEDLGHPLPLLAELD